MPFDGLIWVGQRSGSRDLDEFSLDNLKFHLPFSSAVSVGYTRYYNSLGIVSIFAVFEQKL